MPPGIRRSGNSGKNNPKPPRKLFLTDLLSEAFLWKIEGFALS